MQFTTISESNCESQLNIGTLRPIRIDSFDSKVEPEIFRLKTIRYFREEEVNEIALFSQNSFQFASAASKRSNERAMNIQNWKCSNECAYYVCAFLIIQTVYSMWHLFLLNFNVTIPLADLLRTLSHSLSKSNLIKLVVPLFVLMNLQIVENGRPI